MYLADRRHKGSVVGNETTSHKGEGNPELRAVSQPKQLLQLTASDKLGTVSKVWVTMESGNSFGQELRQVRIFYFAEDRNPRTPHHSHVSLSVAGKIPHS